MPSPFRADPRRCVYVIGEISQEMVARLTPRILELQADSRDPITVYIDSPGGDVSALQRLLALLRAPSQAGEAPCLLITAVTTLAASAAALLLCEGDYAISYPGAVIHFHGIRFQPDRAWTWELAVHAAEILREGNRGSALGLAGRGFHRLAFQYVRWRMVSGGEGERDFVSALRKECSPDIQRLLDYGLKRTREYDDLIGLVESELAPGIGRDGPEFEAATLAILLEARSMKAGAGVRAFSGGGLLDLTRDFFLVLEGMGATRDPEFDFAAERWGAWLLSEPDRSAIGALPPEQREQERQSILWRRSEQELRPLWILEAALCQTLQTGEFRLAPHEAFLLGFIDEVIGGDEITLRDLVEQLQPGRLPDEPEP